MTTTSSLQSMDLNLLVTLDVLLRERNVTRAAERIGLSQPAVSASLARLRRHFDDDLLTRVGNRYQLTPLARRIADLTPHALDGVDRVFSAASEFDPSDMQREFTLVVSDYAAAILGPHLVRVAAEQAPGVRLRLEATTPYLIERAAETMRRFDGIVIPHGFLAEYPHLDLHRDDWVCIVAGNNTVVGAELTQDDLRVLPWVILYDQPSHFAPSTRQLRLAGVELRTDVVIDSFLAMPFLVADSNRIALLQRRLAVQMAGMADLRVLEPPFESVPLVESFWWHPVHHDDPGHQWLRRILGTAVSRMPPGPQVVDPVDTRSRHQLVDL